MQLMEWDRGAAVAVAAAVGGALQPASREVQQIYRALFDVQIILYPFVPD